ncbi:MAG: protein kinase domain-containing protein [Acidobacteriota bacterium]
MAAADERHVLAVAEAIADETPVDWEATPLSDPRIAGLRGIASVAAAFRDAAQRAEDPQPAQESETILFTWGHLHVRERIGGGSFGDVYRAWDPLLERDVALKLWRADEGPADAGARRFLHEARLLARVRHGNVLTVHGVERHDGRAGMWTDLIEGESLEERLARGGPLGAEEAALFGVDLCRALAAVHEAGLVHGDIKAANVLRERGGRIVLADFGAGTTVASRGQNGACGTPLAMAPEILRGGAPTRVSDLYSLGVLLYRLVSGRYPIEPETLGKLLEDHHNGARVPLVDRRPDLPLAFTEVVERALAPNPGDRFRSAGEMERSLARALPDKGHDAPTALSWWPWRWVAAGAGAVVLATVAYLAVLSQRPSLSPAKVRALAVLPFHATGGTDAEFLGPGLAETFARRLRFLPGLSVSPDRSVSRLAGAIFDPQAAGQALGVAALVVGTVESEGGAARLTLELVHAHDGSLLWRTVVNGESRDPAALGDEGVKRLARALRLELPAPTDADASSQGASRPEAVYAWLAGRRLAAVRTGEALERAIVAFERSIHHDPDFAAAHAGLARAWGLAALVEPPREPPPQSWARARHAALRALVLDPGLAAAHAALAEIAFRCDWEWATAEREFLRALDLDPECAETWSSYAELLSVTGRHEEAIVATRRALASDGDSASVRVSAGAVFLEAGRFDEAIGELHTAIRLEPSSAAAYTILGAVHEERGMYAEAVGQWQNALTRSGSDPDEVSDFGRAFASSGMTGVWHWRLARLEERSRRAWASPALIARAHAALGHRSEAMAWLARAVEERDERFLRVKEEPAFDDIRLEPAFAALSDRVLLDVTALPVTAADSESATAAPRHPPSIEVALYRNRDGRSESLANGSTVHPGDRLFLAMTCAEPVHLYVFDEDRNGSLFVLFPLPELELANPLPARQRHRLPGQRDGIGQDWVVTSAGGRETILVVAARRPLPELEREILQLRAADAGRPVQRIERPMPEVVALRGVGGLAASTPPASSRPGSRLTQLAASLAERASQGEAWLREFVLESSPK